MLFFWGGWAGPSFPSFAKGRTWWSAPIWARLGQSGQTGRVVTTRKSMQQDVHAGWQPPAWAQSASGSWALTSGWLVRLLPTLFLPNIQPRSTGLYDGELFFPGVGDGPGVWC